MTATLSGSMKLQGSQQGQMCLSHSCKCVNVTTSFPIVHQLTTLIGIGIFSCHNQSQPLPSHIKLGRFKLFSADFLHTPPEITKQPETAQVAVK